MAITEQQIFEMIQHWLASKENGYFGSSYGGLDIALAPPDGQLNIESCSVHDKFHRTLILSGFCLLKIAKISLNSSFFPKPIKR